MSNESGTDTSVAGPSHAAYRSSDTETDSSTAGRFVCSPAKKPKRAKRLNKKPFKQAFCKGWLEDPQFKLWLQATEDPHQVKCKVCSKFLKAGKTYLQQHASTATRRKNMQRKAGSSIAVPTDAATISIDTSVAGPSHAANTSPDASVSELRRAAIRSSDTETDSSSDTTFVVSAAKKVRSQRPAFRQAWLENPKFKLWLEPVKDCPHNARCSVCSTFITANRTHLNKHVNSREHCMNIVHKKEALSTDDLNFADQVKVAEMRVCLDAVENDISFKLQCQLLKALQKALPNPDVLPYLFLGENKMRDIVKNILNKPIIAESTERSQGKFFSDTRTTDVEKEEDLLAAETIHSRSNRLNTLSDIENRNGAGDREKITKLDLSAFEDIVKRLPFDKIFLDSLDFLNPAITLDFDRHRKGHLDSILKKFESKQLDAPAVNNEWRAMTYFCAKETKEELLTLDVAQFWHHISSLRNLSDGCQKFKNISQLAQLCLSLLHSNTDAE